MNPGIKQADGTICRTGPTCRRHGTKPSTSVPAKTILTSKGTPVNKFRPVSIPVYPGMFNVGDPYYIHPEAIIAEIAEYEYDTFGCQGYCDREDYCRDGTFEGLRVKTNPIEEVLSKILKCLPKDIPQDWVKDLKDLGIDNEDSWELERNYGYYGEENPTLTFSKDYALLEEKLEKLRQKILNQPDLDDGLNVYQTARNIGINTSGKTRPEVLKEYVQQMYGKTAAKRLGNLEPDQFRNDVTSNEIRQAINTQPDDSWKPVKPEPLDPLNSFHIILKRTGSPGYYKYTPIAGFDNLQWMLDNPKEKQKAKVLYVS